MFAHQTPEDEEQAYYTPWCRRLAVYRMLALMGRCPAVMCRICKKEGMSPNGKQWNDFFTTSSAGRFCSIRGTDEVVGTSWKDTKFTIYAGRSWRMEVDARLAQWCEAVGPLGLIVVIQGNELASFPYTHAVRSKVVLAFRGDSSFETKAWNAQQAGADGLIIVQDHDDECIMVDSHDTSIAIPCCTVKNAVGRFILACLHANETVSAVHVRGTNQMMLVGSGYPPAIPSRERQREQELILELGRIEADRRSVQMQVDILELFIGDEAEDRVKKKVAKAAKDQLRSRRIAELAYRMSEEKSREVIYQIDKKHEEIAKEERRLYHEMEKERLREAKAEMEHRMKTKFEKHERARMRKQRALRGYILAIHARAQDRIAKAFAPTVTHTAFGRRGAFVLVYEDGFVDFAGMPPHISSKLAKAKVPGGARIRYVSMASFGEDYYYFLHDNGKVELDVPLALRRVLTDSFVTPERVVFGPGDSWVVIWPGGVCDWQGIPQVLDNVLHDNNYRKRRPVSEVSIGAPEHYGTFSAELGSRKETWPWYVMFRDGWFCSDNFSDDLEDALEDVRKMGCVARSITLGDQAEWMLRYSPLAQDDQAKLTEPGDDLPWVGHAKSDKQAFFAPRGEDDLGVLQTGEAALMQQARPGGPPPLAPGTRALAEPHVQPKARFDASADGGRDRVSIADIQPRISREQKRSISALARDDQAISPRSAAAAGRQPAESMLAQVT